MDGDELRTLKSLMGNDSFSKDHLRPAINILFLITCFIDMNLQFLAGNTFYEISEYFEHYRLTASLFIILVIANTALMHYGYIMIIKIINKDVEIDDILNRLKKNKDR